MGLCVNEKGITTPRGFQLDGCTKACEANIGAGSRALIAYLFISCYLWKPLLLVDRDLIDGLLDFGLILGILS